ncbi:MAG: hypothetical protein ACRELD_11955 [Longimicrobiales bacterium]
MIRTGRRLTRLAHALAPARVGLVVGGTSVAVFAALATLHCGPFTAVASLVQSGPLYPLVRNAVAMPVIYGSIGTASMGFALGYPRHRRAYPFLLLFAAAILVGFTWRTALDSRVWFTLAFGGIGTLVLAAALELWTTATAAARSHRSPSDTLHSKEHKSA